MLTKASTVNQMLAQYNNYIYIQGGSDRDDSYTANKDLFIAKGTSFLILHPYPASYPIFERAEGVNVMFLPHPTGNHTWPGDLNTFLDQFVDASLTVDMAPSQLPPSLEWISPIPPGGGGIGTSDPVLLLTQEILGQPLEMVCNAWNRQQTITKVEFYVNGALVGTDTTWLNGGTNASFTWTVSGSGTNNLRAIAYDDLDQKATSAYVYFEVVGADVVRPFITRLLLLKMRQEFRLILCSR